MEIVLPIADIGAAYAAASRAGCVVEGLRLRPCGARDLRIEDPFGYYVRLTEPHEVLAEGPRAARRQATARRGRARRRP